MNTRRRTRGDETWNRLLNWTDSQKASERLAGHILAMDGFSSIDPSQPLGGPDGLKDLVCSKDGVRWVVAAYFPNGQKPFSEIRTKFEHDSQGAVRNDVRGFAFITNQYLTAGERSKLVESAKVELVEIYHLERIVHILNTPVCYGIRLEFLDIEMTKEEQLSFFGAVTSGVEELQKEVRSFLESLGGTEFSESIPIDELREFAETLGRLANQSSFRSGPNWIMESPPPLQQLRVPLVELKEFADILYGLASRPSFRTGSNYIIESPPPLEQLRIPLAELKEFAEILNQLVGTSDLSPILPISSPAPIRQLRVPIDDLREYEEPLDRILSKIEKMRVLDSGG